MAVITKKKNSNKRYRFNLITPKILGKSLFEISPWFI